MPAVAWIWYVTVGFLTVMDPVPGAPSGTNCTVFLPVIALQAPVQSPSSQWKILQFRSACDDFCGSAEDPSSQKPGVADEILGVVWMIVCIGDILLTIAEPMVREVVPGTILKSKSIIVHPIEDIHHLVDAKISTSVVV